ncbi:MAG: PIN domain-containing protein [Methanosarcinaceae archaeon]|nr:PIN domain-containing protein [Methanosarcinaceae archaeon]
MSSFIISEVITEIGKRSGGKAGYNLYNYFEDSCDIVHLDKDLLAESMELFFKYDGTLSLADASSIAVMDMLEIKEIVSFDSDFNKVSHVCRIFK